MQPVFYPPQQYPQGHHHNSYNSFFPYNPDNRGYTRGKYTKGKKEHKEKPQKEDNFPSLS